MVKDLTDREALELALVENLQREDLSPVEEARGYQALLEMGLTQEEVARRVGKARSTVANALRLLQLPPEALGPWSGGDHRGPRPGPPHAGARGPALGA